MEHARIFIAILLSFLVFLAWDFIFGPKRPMQPAEQPVETSETAEKPVDRPTVQTAEKTVESTAVSPEPQPEKPAVGSSTIESRTIIVDTPLYRAEFSERGAVLKSFVLKDYRESAGEDSALKQMVSSDVPGGTLVFGFKGQLPTPPGAALYLADQKRDILELKDSPAPLTFTHVSPEGVVIVKTYRFDPKSYLFDLSVAVKNGSSAAIDAPASLSLHTLLQISNRAYGFEGPSALMGGALEEVKVKDIDEGKTIKGAIEWIAIQDRYFMSSIIPKEVSEAAMQLAYRDDIVTAGFVHPEEAIGPGGQRTFAYTLFFGPKSMKLLSGFHNQLDKAIDFGWFDFLAKPFLWLMNFIYDHLIANYGIAIIILTLIIKVLLFPLGTKSYKSMSEMKKLQPLVQEIKEKYKNDRKRMNEETMALYRTYKINPLGGCLPMVVQIPVFFAFYRMLYQAIELRHAPFFGWINDLSAPDRLFRFDFAVPFMEPPYGIPVLTVIMGASMLLQQKMSPPMGDPTQAKMMMLMPIVFTVIFINFSSGLVLYWLVNNIFSIAQQYYTTKKFA